MSWFCQQYLIFNSSPAEQLVAVADLRVGGEDGVGHKELVGGPAEEEGGDDDQHQLDHLPLGPGLGRWQAKPLSRGRAGEGHSCYSNRQLFSPPSYFCPAQLTRFCRPVHSPNLPYSKGIGSHAAAIPV